MGNGIKDRIVEWAMAGGDFAAGLSLFLSFNRNAFYIRNIEAKGVDRGMKTLVAEFSNKTRIPAKEIWGMMAGGRESLPQPLPRRGVEERLLHFARNDGQGCFAPSTMTEEKKRTTKLREEFPFLGSKDCPEELMILVNKMLTAYDTYREEREKLFDIDTNDLEKCYEVGRETLDAYIENREIWEELNYYKIHAKVLGKHPEFRMRKLREDYRLDSTMNLVKISGNNIPRKMSYYKKQLASDKTKNREELMDKMADAELELGVIREILIERGEM